MPRGLRRIRPFRAQFTPEKKWKQEGHTPWGAQLYRETRPHGENVPKLDENGEQVWVRSEITGQKLYKRRMLKKFTLTRLFYLVDEGNGNIRKQDYRPPTPEEIAAAERNNAIQKLKDDLFAKMVDSGMTADQLLAAFKQGPTAELTYEAPPEPGDVIVDDDEDEEFGLSEVTDEDYEAAAQAAREEIARAEAAEAEATEPEEAETGGVQLEDRDEPAAADEEEEEETAEEKQPPDLEL